MGKQTAQAKKDCCHKYQQVSLTANVKIFHAANH